MRDRYLRQRAYREKQKRDYRMGDRNYASEYDYRDGAMPRRNRYEYEDDYMDYEQPRERRRMYDYAMRDYGEKEYEEEYEKDLKSWIKKLKKFDRFGMSKEQIINAAKQMGVNFEEYDEDEFYAIYLMHVSDYPTVSNDSRMYLGMAKSWLEDKDLKIDPSEKVCIYLYEIVMGVE